MGLSGLVRLYALLLGEVAAGEEGKSSVGGKIGVLRVERMETAGTD